MACSTADFTQLLSSTPEIFLKPATSLHTAWATATKRYLDPLASDITKAQKKRLQDKWNRKRVDKHRHFRSQALHLQEVHTDGFTPRQIWEQANRVLNASVQDTAHELALLREPEAEIVSSQSSPHKKSRGTQDEEHGFEVTTETDQISDNSPSDDPVSIQNGEIADEDSNGEGDERVTEDNKDGEDGEDDDDHDSMSIDGVQPSSRRKKDKKSISASDIKFVQDPHKLNDGFFSIDEFNAQTALFEQKDAKGMRDSDDDDDDEGAIDWRADPLSLSAINGDKEDNESADQDYPKKDDGSDSEGMDEDGDFDESEMGLMGGNANDIKYADFFDPPPSKAPKGRQNGVLSKHKSPTPDEDIEARIRRAISDVQRDLFDDDMSDDEEMDGSARQTGTAQSTHEKRQAKLTDEIRRLEAANVSKKEWMLSGEAKAPDRPVNSLIEEDLEFERVGKPVPVISTEVSDDIEALIKRRILAKEFDEVPRRQPYIPGSEAQRKRDQFTLDETKPQQSLAELYEEDHLRKTDSAFVDQKSEKLKGDHEEIARLWSNISSQLDTLSSWHHKPKPPQASINVVTDVATIAMEDARPTGGAGMDSSGMLAPQEMYAPGDEGKVRGEVVLKSGVTVSKEEMTREAKLRRRRREKQKLKKNSSQPLRTGKQAEKQRIVSDLKKGGVKVIGNQGDLKDVYGNKVSSNENRGQLVLKL
ncbi:U3 small nucleolar ribonucleoprotein Mpp10 [Blastomyces dermatitidis ATCC 18188]|uniref:U3 small nucleolar ribonucleoprotein protein MPP10 n=1 Tax=Ajellomyces dermatitidis (strain ATCC 18188 / CBS 674.68) TaxID=653446 RepID=F2TPJ2_AJEDA|nr:U3 small nucleolar ribonucleoprotein Mpp10 [Blastomyces dermatitidis ATCC 18188]